MRLLRRLVVHLTGKVGAFIMEIIPLGLRVGLMLLNRPEYPESGSFSHCTVYFDLAPGIINDSPDNVQPNARAFDVRMKSLEHLENLFLILASNAQSIVSYFDNVIV